MFVVNVATQGVAAVGRKMEQLGNRLGRLVHKDQPCRLVSILAPRNFLYVGLVWSAFAALHLAVLIHRASRATDIAPYVYAFVIAEGALIHLLVIGSVAALALAAFAAIKIAQAAGYLQNQ